MTYLKSLNGNCYHDQWQAQSSDGYTTKAKWYLGENHIEVQVDGYHPSRSSWSWAAIKPALIDIVERWWYFIGQVFEGCNITNLTGIYKQRPSRWWVLLHVAIGWEDDYKIVKLVAATNPKKLMSTWTRFRVRYNLITQWRGSYGERQIRQCCIQRSSYICQSHCHLTLDSCRILVPVV